MAPETPLRAHRQNPSVVRRVRAVLPPALATAIALLLGSVAPLVSPLLIALALGALVANVPRLRGALGEDSAAMNRLLLRAGVVLLGLKIVLADILALGVAGIAVIALTVAVTFTSTRALGRRLGVGRELTTLIAAGFSICGAAAIAAVESSVRARSKDVALAVALVTVFGTAMILTIPALGDVLGLSDEQTAVWAGASIHEVAQVIAAASLIGAGTSAVVALAITVKLGRVLLLAPVQLATARSREDGDGRPDVPLFVLGFLAAATLRSTGLLPTSAIGLADHLTTALLSAAMFGLGTGIVVRNLWPVPPRVIALAAAATAVATTTPLVLISVLA